MGRASAFKSVVCPAGQVEQQVASAFDVIKKVADRLEELNALAAYVGSLNRIFEIKYEDLVLYTRLVVDGEDAPWQVVADLSIVNDALSRLEAVDQTIDLINAQVALAELAKNTAEQIAITVENSRQQIIQLSESIDADFQTWLAQIEALRDAAVAARDAAIVARTAAQSAQTAAETAQTGAQVAQAGAVSARDAAAASETNAGGHANMASVYKDGAVTAANLAKDWANKAPNQEVADGLYSARHWAGEAQQYAESFPVLMWGNLSGAITDQQDLIAYIDSRIASEGGGSGSGGGGFVVSSTPPEFPIAGTRWVDDDGTEYTYLIDGDSGQWVQLGDPLVLGGLLVLDGGTY